MADAIALREGLSKDNEKVLAKAMEANLSWITTGQFRQYKIADYVDTSKIDTTSGYLLEYDMRQDGDTSKFTTGSGVKIQLDSPTALDTNPEMFSYVQGMLAKMEEAFYSDTFCAGDGTHYSQFVDMQSLVDYFIIFHLFKNIEFGWLSIFLYIEGGKIYFGPAWDFDGSSGNQVTLYQDWMNPESWFYMGGRAEWWKQLCGDPYFVTRVEERWQEIRPLLHLYMESLPQWNDYISAEANANFKHFGPPKNWYDGGEGCKSYATEYNTLVDWLNRRIAWLDQQWSMRDPNMEGTGLEASDRMQLSLTYLDDTPLAEDTLTVRGAKSDYLYDLSQHGNLKLTVNTQHTTHRSMLVYVNGKLRCQAVLDMSGPATVNIPRTMLDSTPGAVNVIYVVGINHEGNHYRAGYVTLRMAEVIPQPGQRVVRIGDQYLVVDRGGQITLPQINVHADGFTALGWTDGNKESYAPGETITPAKSTYLWIDWQRDDLVAELIVQDGKADESVKTPTPIVPTPAEPEAGGMGFLGWSLLIGIPALVMGGALTTLLLIRKKRK